jgi:hypothetical protein
VKKNIILRPYQENSIDKIVSSNGDRIVVAGTGSGKTIICLKSVMQLGFNRLLILVPTRSSIDTWEQHLNNMSKPYTLINGWTKKRREKFYNDQNWFLKEECKIVIMLYQTMVKDVSYLTNHKFGVNFIIGDECHFFRNHQRQVYNALKKFSSTAKNAVKVRKIFTSGTLQAKGPQNLWCALNLIRPIGFNSYHEFIERYCVLHNDGYSTKIEAVRASTIQELRDRISPYIITIKSKEVELFVPKVLSHKLKVQLSPKVRKAYDQLKEELFLEIGNEILLSQNVVANCVNLRKLLTCPALIDEKLGVGDAIENVVEHSYLESDLPHISIFSDFKKPFIIWKQFLEKKGFHVEILSNDSKESNADIRSRFASMCNKVPSVLLCTIPYAISFDLPTVRDLYLIGFSWQNIHNKQTEGRVRRGDIEDKPFANAYYVCHDDTIEDRVFDILDQNRNNTSHIANIE